MERCNRKSSNPYDAFNEIADELIIKINLELKWEIFY